LEVSQPRNWEDFAWQKKIKNITVISKINLYRIKSRIIFVSVQRETLKEKSHEKFFKKVEKKFGDKIKRLYLCTEQLIF